MRDSTSNGLPERYQKALRAHLAQDSGSGLQSAYDLGLEALQLGLETVDLAKIHEDALKSLKPPQGFASGFQELSSLGDIFFSAVMLPIEQMPLPVLEVEADPNEPSVMLEERTLDLAGSRREMRKQTSGCKASEAALEVSETHADELLQESRKLESHVQIMTRKIMTSHEEERKRMSHELQNEIAQTLLGIHVRLLALRKAAAISSPSFAQEITMTQELIGESVKVIHRYALEIGLAHEN